ncbi:MAG: ABC transporter substrate-binding protein [Rhodobacteraceae bacterium]|nr:ABC transporter substrate-binding protein [Paracoccaceae bacterium]
MADNITLSAAVRQNLLTLQSTADLMSGVQNKLATGLKVNSALDNPNSFFTASGLNSRAGDLNNLLEDMGQSLQTLKASDEGITTITDLVETAKAKANQALQTGSQYERAQYAKQYNDLLEQIEDVAKDSGYKGKNLLAGDGNDLTTIFNEDATSKLKVNAVDYTDTSLSTGLNLNDLDLTKGSATGFAIEGGTATYTITDANGDTLTSSSKLASGTAFALTEIIKLYDATATPGAVTGSSLTITSTTTVQDLVNEINEAPGVRATFNESTGELNIVSNADATLRLGTAAATAAAFAAIATVAATAATATTQKLTSFGSYDLGDTLTLTDGNNYELGSLEIEADTTIADLVNFIDDFNGVDASFKNGKIALESDTDLSLTSDNVNFNAVDFVQDSNGVTIDALQDSGFSTDGKINRVIDRLTTALNNLRSQASDFGTNLSIVEIREDFTNNLINTLEEGAGLLTLADTNEEGANLLALQTRQQLASTSLSFASQADQTVLSLF